MNFGSLKSKNVVVTGCNKGIGKSILVDFAKNGANVYACVRTINKEFILFTKDLEKNYKTQIKIIKLDLSKNSSISECTSNILKNTKKIDVLVNNAGILSNSLFQMTSEKNLKEIFQINFFSQIYFTQMISRAMAKNKKGNIIFISSTSGIDGDYGRFAYSSSKAAIINSVRTISKELSNFNIRVNSVSPGLTKTELMYSNTKENILKSEIQKISLKRMAETDEISKVVLFLASENSNYINGQNLIVDGGRS